MGLTCRSKAGDKLDRGSVHLFCSWPMDSVRGLFSRCVGAWLEILHQILDRLVNEFAAGVNVLASIGGKYRSERRRSSIANVFVDKG